jgi:hypothetical protein
LSGKLKGQFFIAGALGLCVMFYAGFSMIPALTSGDTRNLEALSDNLEAEIPRALNLIILDSGNPSELGDFMDFLQTSTSDRYLTMDSVWIVTSPNPGNPGDVDVTVGNHFGTTQEIQAEVDGNLRALNLNLGTSTTYSLSGVSQDMNVSVVFSGRSWSGTLSRDKTNLYCYLGLSRNQDFVVKEIVA